MKSTTTINWNKGEVSERHNSRDEELCKNESHIDLYNEHGLSFHETLFHKDLREAYIELFSKFIEIYNAGQKRKSRKIDIDSYMQSIIDDTRGKRQTKRVNGKKVVDENSRQGKQLSYEINACVGNTYRQKDENGKTLYDDTNHHIRPEEFPRELQHEILREYSAEFQDRNFYFYVVNINIHGDEGFYNRRGEWEYANIGVHIEFVPFSDGFKQGLFVQNSMNKALAKMGFTSTECYSDWAKNEQKILEEITLRKYKEYCLSNPVFHQKHGDLELYHPVQDKTREGGKTKEQLAHEQELDESISEVETMKKNLQVELESNQKKNEELNQLKSETEKLKNEANADRELAKQEKEEAKATSASAKKEFDKAVIAQQLYDEAYLEIAKYEKEVETLKQKSSKQISRVENMDLKGAFFDWIKNHKPEQYRELKISHKEFKESVKKIVEIKNVSTPKVVEEDIVKLVNKEVQHLKDVNEEYEEMQNEKSKLEKELGYTTNRVNTVDDDLDLSDDIKNMLSNMTPQERVKFMLANPELGL